MIKLLPDLFAALTVALMMIPAVWLLVRLIRRMCGRGTLTPGRFTVIPPNRELVQIFLIALLTRIVLILFSFVILRYSGGATGKAETDFYKLWVHWDARHYLGIAREGYTDVGTERLRLVFFPLYPVLIRFLSVFFANNMEYTGTVISILCGSVSAVLLYILAINVLPSQAKEAVFFFLLNPLSVFLCCVYTEGLFLMLTLSAYLLRRFGHPWLSAFMGFLSAFTRMPGIIVAGFVIIDLLESFASHTLTPGKLFAGIAQMGIVFGGLVLYWGVNRAVTGDPFMYMVYQRENWFQEPGTFWASARNTMSYFLGSVDDTDHWWTWGSQGIAMVLVMILMICSRKLPFDLLAYSFVYVAVVLSPTWLLSAPRYLFGLFVLPLMQAETLRRMPGWIRSICLMTSGLLLLLYVYGFTIAVEVL